MRFGFHISIAGGFSKVVKRAIDLGCDTVQIFTKSPRGWKYVPIDEKDAEACWKGLSENDIKPLVVHLPYLPNLASSDKELFEKSCKAVEEDLKRASFLKASYLVMHPGANSSLEKGIEAIIKGINRVFKKVKNDIILLLENTAGEGNEIGATFEEIKKIIDGIEEKERVGLLLDTAHAFEAGYDLSNDEGIQRTLEEIDEKISLKKLYVSHLNDSKTPLGSHLDRHWHIGEGYIGKEGFRKLINHHLLKRLPGIMETPRKSLKDDLINMKVIRSLEEK